MAYKADKITMQVLRYALEAICDDMGYALMRMGRSTIVKEIQDVNCAVLDPQGQILSQAHLCPLLMFSLPTTCTYLVKRYAREDLHEGDVIISNDPYMGGQHLMDVQFFSPVIFDGELMGFVANIAHQLDIGGSIPGGVAGGTTEVYAEGLRLPLVKLFREGKEDPQMFSLIGANIRFPDKTLDDFRAQAATASIGVKRLKELIAKFGAEVFQECTKMLMDYCEGLVRQELKAMPDGDYTGVDYLDNDGITDEPVKLQINIHKRGDRMKVDFQGSSHQTKGNVNSTAACSQGGVYYTLIGIVDPYMPLNSGCFRPVEIDNEEGLITNPRPPAAVTARAMTLSKIPEAMLHAMSSIVPERVIAGSHGQATTCNFVGTYPETGKLFSYMEIQGGGSGARPDKDGCDGQDMHMGRFMNTPVEAAELEFPIMIECYDFLPDSGGAGKWRGGVTMHRDIRFHTDVTWARYQGRRDFAPQGLFGGKEGSKSSFVLNPGTEKEEYPAAMGVSQIKAGDLLSIRLPGSGGYGPPWERDPELVRWDVINGKVSLRSAKEDYLVVLNPDLTINEKETKALRSTESKSG